MLNDVGIGRKRILRRCIIENHGLTGAQDVLNKGLRQCARTGCITFAYVNGYILSVRSRFRVYRQFVTSWADQEAAISAGVLDRRTHEPVDELFEHYLAGECLRDLDHGSDIEPFGLWARLCRPD